MSCPCFPARTGEVKGGAGKPTEAAVDVALRREVNGIGHKVIVREPPAWCLGKWGGEDVAVVLIEDFSMGHKGIEIKGRELLIRKR